MNTSKMIELFYDNLRRERWYEIQTFFLRKWYIRENRRTMMEELMY